MKTTDIQNLIGRFLEGDTTLAEERQLYSYFQGPHVAPELLPYRQMFVDLGALQPKAKTVRLRPISRWMVGIAASLLLLVGAYGVWNHQQRSRLLALYESSYTIVNGQRNDDIVEIEAQIKATLADAERIESSLKEQNTIGQAEQEVLQSISDEGERSEIETFLKQ